MDQQSLMNAVGYGGYNTKPAPTSGVGPYASGSQYGAALQRVAQPATQGYDPNAFIKASLQTLNPIAHPAYYNTGQALQQAAAQAKSQVDPYYNQEMNTFNTIFAAQQQNAQQQQQLTNAGIQSQLENTLQGNEIAQGRVGEDTTNALSNMANAQQNYKQTEGMQFDIAQRGLAGQLGQAGTAESGGGQQQVQQAQTQEQLGQQAQGQQYQVQRQAQELFANRSFQDISRSSSIAGTQAGQQKQQSQLDLNKQLQQIAQNQADITNKLLTSQKAEEAAATNRNYDIGLSQFYNGLRGMNPVDLLATHQSYGMI